MGELIDLNSTIPASRIDSAMALDTEYIAADTAHTNAADPHSQYLLQSEGDARYRQNSVALMDSDIPAAIARDSEVTAAVVAHVGATDPHIQYLLPVEGDARYRQLGTGETFTATAKAIGTSTGAIATTDNTQANKCGLEVQSANASSAAYLSLHRTGIYGVHLGLDINNQLSVGGWSLGNVSYKLFHEGSPPLAKAPLPTAESAGNSFVVSWNSIQPGLGIAELCNYAGLGGGDAFNFFRMPGAEAVAPTISNRVARIDINGAYIQTSDKRAKSNVSPAPGLTAILALRPLRYKHWNCVGFDEKLKSLKLGTIYTDKIGLLAQDVQKPLPEAVSTPESEAELLGIDYSVIVSCAVKAIQELEAQVQELRSQIAAIPKK